MVAFVLATGAYGLWLAGSPTTERARRFDAQRLTDLQMITWGIDEYWNIHNALPASFAEFRSERSIGISSIADPETHIPYKYAPKTAETYDLCATFALPSSVEHLNQPIPPSVYPVPTDSNRFPTFWKHPAGGVCFLVQVIKHPPKG